MQRDKLERLVGMIPEDKRAEFFDVMAALEQAQSAPKLPPYPKNWRGIPEYRTMCLTLDHLQSRGAEVGQCLQKVVYSTESVRDSVFSQFEYFGDRLDGGSLSSLFKGAENGSGTALVYFIPQHHRDTSGAPFANVFISQSLFDRCYADPDMGGGSDLLTHQSILKLAAEAVEDMANRKMRVPSLIPIVVYPQKKDAAEGED